MQQYYLDFASTYGGCDYGTSTYQNATTNVCDTQTTTTSSGAGSGGSLVDTGFIVAVVVTIAALIILISLIVRIWKRPSKPTPPSPKTPAGDGAYGNGKF